MKGFMIQKQKTATALSEPEPSAKQGKKQQFQEQDPVPVPCQSSHKAHNNLHKKINSFLERLKHPEINGYPVGFTAVLKYFFYSLFLRETDEKKRNKKLRYFSAMEYLEFYRNQKKKNKQLKQEQKTR